MVQEISPNIYYVVPIFVNIGAVIAVLYVGA
jgi:hypothetical protein